MTSPPVQHAVDASILEPFAYISETPGKDVRGALIDAFNVWLKIPPEKVTQIKSIISRLHNASLLVDDIEDGSQLRRGKPVAHAIFGVPYTLNAANYAYFVALEECHRLGSPEALSVFVEELLNLHRGQGQDIVWRDTQKVPSEKEYYSMVLDKTGGLFRLAVSRRRLNLMCRGDGVFMRPRRRDGASTRPQTCLARELRRCRDRAVLDSIPRRRDGVDAVVGESTRLANEHINQHRSASWPRSRHETRASSASSWTSSRSTSK